MSERDARRVAIRGWVQGVGFRAFVEHLALKRGLEGWVRNRRDGSVEAIFAGAPEAIRAVVDACRSGPRGAWVEAIDESAGTPELLAQRHPGEHFSVLWTQ